MGVPLPSNTTVGVNDSTVTFAKLTSAPLYGMKAGWLMVAVGQGELARA